MTVDWRTLIQDATEQHEPLIQDAARDRDVDRSAPPRAQNHNQDATGLYTVRHTTYNVPTAYAHRPSTFHGDQINRLDIFHRVINRQTDRAELRGT